MPSAVVHVRFVLDEALEGVSGFQLEEDPHVWPAADVAFDDRALSRVLDRKLRVRAAQLVDLYDDFASTRLPAAIRAAQHRARAHERENAEELLLGFFQRRDPYNDGRLALVDLVAAVRELDLSGRGPSARGAGKLPAEILLALAPAADWDGLVEYGPLVPLAAEAADAWDGWEYYREPDATADEKGTATFKSPRDEKDGGTDADGMDADEARAVAAFEAVHKWQTQLLEGKLRQLLEAAGATNAADVDGEPLEDEVADDGDGLEDKAAADEDADDHQDTQHDASSSSSLLPRPLFVTARQLRAALESPSLLLSAPETNLFLALALESSSPSTNGDEGEPLLAVAPLPELVRRARRLLFRFQRRTFLARDPEDALASYLLREFEAFERDTLKGSAQHLSGALSLKQAKRVVLEELPRLALSLLQAAQCVALCDARRHPRDDRVRYRECVPEMAAYLRQDVGDAQLAGAAAAAGCEDAKAALLALASREREEEVRAASLRVFRALDDKQLGVVSLGSLADAAADPAGAGRVNYAVFQHRVLPLALAMAQRRLVAEHGGVAADAKD